MDWNQVLITLLLVFAVGVAVLGHVIVEALREIDRLRAVQGDPAAVYESLLRSLHAERASHLATRMELVEVQRSLKKEQDNYRHMRDGYQLGRHIMQEVQTYCTKYMLGAPYVLKDVYDIAGKWATGTVFGMPCDLPPGKPHPVTPLPAFDDPEREQKETLDFARQYFYPTRIDYVYQIRKRTGPIMGSGGEETD